MATSTSSFSITSSSSPPPNRHLFDRRYGSVVDDWKDPSEEALAGGRGMYCSFGINSRFCILPLAKTLIKMASEPVDLTANSAVRDLQRPDLLSLQLLQAALTDQFQKVKSFLPKPEFNHFSLKGNFSSQDASSLSNEVESTKFASRLE